MGNVHVSMTERRSSKQQSTGKRRAARGISQREVEDVEEMSTPRTPVIYEVVRRLGDEEMERPAFSLWWSGVAAGLSISFSLLAQAVLHTHLPDAPWRDLIAAFGYSIGFLIVVLGRQQLFTESTITVVLPVLNDLSLENLWRMLRLWAIVLLANIAGTLFAAIFCTYLPAVPEDIHQGMMELSRILTNIGWWQMLLRGIASGFLIAAMVWMLPSAETSKLAVITIMTWLIAVGGFTHIIAGSMEAWLLVLAGDWTLWHMVGNFAVPVLIGNVVGGTALFALISYAQVVEEI
ncbi:formate/nitrite transporter family protein [Pseudolabrys taiwanensis]|nr:formate/nitrite transporter family protein [Pseudolabrys taiwanensis]